MTSLAGKVCIVTGGGRGIGRAIALAFARKDAELVLVARTESELQAVGEEIGEIHHRPLLVTADISDENAAVRIAKETERMFGRVDILVNNAATFGGGPVESLAVETWDRVLSVNLRGTFLVTQAVLPLMKRNEQGTIVMMASTSGKRGDPGGCAYSASKFGMIGFAQSLSAEVRHHNIRVITVNPSAVDTSTTPSVEKPHGGKGSRLCAEDVAETVVYSVLMPGRAMVREVELWATNP